ncbi:MULTISPECIES: cytochrome c-type biogenesis protein [Shewanella]|uniref:cytochrome c-type biogenesis protein n=1 Tax=Shewanella TaxID=22 RepID=UPI001BBCFB87|nr:MULTISPECIES: cytochrome c-type biogenesis protein [Shewanella]GIU02533.1 cytochrome c biogenesis protein [Shewanella sp. KT0246]
MNQLERVFNILTSPVLTLLLAVWLICFALTADANTDNKQFSRAQYSADEKRQLGFEIAQELRCPSSDNRNLFDSETQIANELKGHIFKKLDEGQSKQQIIDFMVARFGERIRYTPSLKLGTLALWVIPFGLILLAAIGGIAWIRKQQATTETTSYENYYE